ncbi:S-layer homology domain-containing protein [Paenibacillus sp. LS1]|uniref:fibronectin type III domain-containing protein n=1 Tax=Paenibacillus sp. LS1 TaxID=2992120 RepID=UPI0022307CFD|nr:S-layer homology domain-containing protein [Paenibacillus sp. LS1]MCW3793792.1 S-layer homology domain-containing protein [Paenibacillus sp. LS1]
MIRSYLYKSIIVFLCFIMIVPTIGATSLYAAYSYQYEAYNVVNGSKGDFVFSTSATEGTYPDDGIHTDGYWYVKDYLTNTAPVVNITSSGDKTLYNDGGEFSISGTVQDEDNDPVNIIASVGGVSKSIEISDTQTTKNWTLTWSGKEIPVGVYATTMVWFADYGPGSELYYQGKLTIQQQIYYYWSKFRVTKTLPYSWSTWQLSGQGPNVSGFYTGFTADPDMRTSKVQGTYFYHLSAEQPVGYTTHFNDPYNVIRYTRISDSAYQQGDLYWNPQGSQSTKGSLMEANIKATQNTYPIDGVHTDGYWYTRIGLLPNTNPVITVTQSGNKSINLKAGNDTFTLSGTVSDVDNDTLSISASIGGVEKQVVVSQTKDAKAWSLVWRTSEFSNSGTFSRPVITVDDGKGGVSTATYTGNLTVNTNALYYWDKYSTKNQVSSWSMQEVNRGNYFIDSFSGYDGYTFDRDKGEFIGTGQYDIYPTYPTWAGRGKYNIYYRGMTYNVVTNSGVDYIRYEIVPAASVKVKDKISEANILDIDKTYPDDGVHSDGFWYIKKSTTNMSPVLVVENSDQMIGTAAKEISLKGSAFDSDGDQITISATLNGVTKSTSLTGSGAWQLDWSVNEIPEGTYTNIKISGTDGNQGTDTITYNGRIIFDKVAPGKPEVTLSHNTWTNKDVKLIAKHGVDVGSGANYTEYTRDGETWNQYNEPLIIGDSGEWTYQFRTTDKAGNVGKSNEVTVRVDKQAPTAPVMSFSEESYTQDPVKITLKDGKDDLSGVDRTEVKLGTGNWTTYNGEMNVDEEGQTDVWARTIDVAGNISPEAAAKVLIDRTAPTEPSYTLSESHWTNKDVTFHLNGSQDASDVYYEYKIGDSPYTTGDSGSVTESGEHTITARAVDAVGLMSPEIKFDIRIDKELPDVDFAPNGLQWSMQGTDVQIKASDRLSGVIEPVYVEISQSEQPSEAWQVMPDTGKVAIDDKEGTWYVHTKVTDKAGNIGMGTSNPYQVQMAPDEPTLEATAISASEVKLSWDLPGGKRYTSGYTYTIKNMITGTEKILEYPVHEYVDQQLQGGQVYNYQLTIRNHVGSVETQASALTYPGSPGVDISPVFRTPGEMLINISPVPTATDYRLKLIDKQGQILENGLVASTQKALTGLIPGSSYTVHVSAINDSGEGLATSVGFLTLPETPTGFTAIEIKEDSVNTEWQSVTTATYYDLYRNNELLHNGGDLNYKDTGLTPGTEYEYVVAAGNETGEGDVSEPLNVMTLPEQDNSLQVLGFSTTGFTAQWNGVPSGIKYHLQVYDLEQNLVAEYQGPNLEYTASGLEPGKEYSVSLVAFNRTGAGKAKIVRTVTLPSNVESVQVTGIGETEAEFNISSVTGATHYKIDLNGEEFLTNDLNYVLSPLQGSTVYSGTVQAGNSSGWSEPTAFSFLTKPVRPALLTVKTFSETGMTLTWEEDKTASRYWITDEQGNRTDVTESELYVADLQPGSEYRFKVATENATGIGSESEIVWSTRTEAPELERVDVQNSDATVSWTEPQGALRYEITDKATGQVYYSGSEPVAHLTQLQVGYVYNLTLSAFNKTDHASKGVLVKLVTRAELNNSNVKITNVKSHSVTMEIETAGQEIQEYVILRNGVKITKVEAGSQVSYTDTEVEPGKTYEYEIVPVNEGGEGKGVKLTTLTATKPVSAPDVKSGDGWAEISFQAVEQANEYVVLDKNGTELWRGDTLPIRLEGLELGTKTILNIVTENAAGYPSAPVSVPVWTLPSVPMGIESSASERSITLNFSTVLSTEGLTEFVIYKAGKEVGRVGAGEKSWTDKNLTPNTKHMYEVRAVNLGGESTKGIKVEQTTKQEQPVNPGSPSAPTPPSNHDKDSDKPENDKPDDVKGDQQVNDKSRPVSGVFKDVSGSSFAKNEIETLAKDGVIKGISTNAFAPNKQITRIEFAALIVRVLNASPDESITMPFHDVKDTAWYRTELNAAIVNGIAKGFNSNEFRPNAVVNREQAAKMLVNVLINEGLTPSTKAQQFSDDSDIAVWALDDVKMATEQKFVQGYPDNTFRPKHGLTRAEAAVMIYRLRDHLNSISK